MKNTVLIILFVFGGLFSNNSLAVSLIDSEVDDSVIESIERSEHAKSREIKQFWQGWRERISTAQSLRELEAIILKALHSPTITGDYGTVSGLSAGLILKVFDQEIAIKINELQEKDPDRKASRAQAVELVARITEEAPRFYSRAPIGDFDRLQTSVIYHLARQARTFAEFSTIIADGILKFSKGDHKLAFEILFGRNADFLANNLRTRAQIETFANLIFPKTSGLSEQNDQAVSILRSLVYGESITGLLRWGRDGFLAIYADELVERDWQQSHGELLRCRKIFHGE